MLKNTIKDESSKKNIKQKYKKLPVGVENFAEIRKRDFYYIDKTRLIEKLLNNWGKANLFTRPRRFGKSLNMSMLKNFFEIGCQKELFDGLDISKNQELCNEYMGKFPVISISLKGVNADNFSKAKLILAKIINEEARRFQFLLQSDRLTEIDKDVFRLLLSKNMDEETLVYSLRELTELLDKHYEQQVIVLIDEYDVPLAKANERNYYKEMVDFIRNLFENVLKTNDHLFLAVLTGCLRVAKESIFTGLNNFKVNSLTSVTFDEFFGFTDCEIKKLLEYYHQMDQYDVLKEWYDGYRFGNMEIYCPWDVICYCADHVENPMKNPENYWINTSDNQLIHRFIDMEQQKKLTKIELEALVNGDTVQKEISEELTYQELYASVDNIWSALFMTGYLTQKGQPDGNRYELAIPNMEIRNIVTEHILTLFKEQVKNDGKLLENFCDALLKGRVKEIEKLFSEYMVKTISVRDTFVRRATRENFYHGILLGILAYKEEWVVKSNKESGDGFSDIMIRTDDSNIGIIIEVKYAEVGQVKVQCEKALEQIEQKKYMSEFRQEGMQTILKYGIVCNKKQCWVALEREETSQKDN